MKFTKNNTINGKFMMLNTVNGIFVDEETGEIVPVAELIEQAMDGQPFDLSVKSSVMEDITPDENNSES